MWNARPRPVPWICVSDDRAGATGQGDGAEMSGFVLFGFPGVGSPARKTIATSPGGIPAIGSKVSYLSFLPVPRGIRAYAPTSIGSPANVTPMCAAACSCVFATYATKHPLSAVAMPSMCTAKYSQPTLDFFALASSHAGVVGDGAFAKPAGSSLGASRSFFPHDARMHSASVTITRFMRGSSAAWVSAAFDAFSEMDLNRGAWTPMSLFFRH